MKCPHCSSSVSDGSRYCTRCGKAVADCDDSEGPFKFEAFISYRHIKRDRDIAIRIQRKIENRLVPKALRRDGARRLGKCFRDEDELPTDGSLNDMIEDALSQSRFLIVVCSPEMLESKWVAREVELFSQMHGRDRVLLALADAEPDEAFPLLLRTRVEEGPDRRMNEIQTEPIAADFRAGAGKKFDSEVLRLIAPIIGCGYDDLRQRVRARRMRMISSIAAGVAAVSLGFASFSFVQQRQIEENYNDALRNQSEYLTTEARDLYEAGDRMQAIQVALAALPGQGGDRPLVPTAQEALEDITDVYPLKQDWRACFSRYEATIKYGNKDVMSEDGSMFAVKDSTGHVSVYETTSGKVLASIESPSGEYSALGMAFCGNELYELMGNDTVVAYSMETGQRVFENNLNAASSVTWGICADAEDGVLYVVRKDHDSTLLIDVIETSESRTTSYEIDISNEPLQGITFSVDISPDGKILLVASEDMAYVIDAQTMGYRAIATNMGKYSSFKVEDDAVYLASYESNDAQRAAVDYEVIAYDASTLNEKWRYNGRAFGSAGGWVVIHNGSPRIQDTFKVDGEDMLCVCAGDHAMLFDSVTGELRSDLELSEAVLAARVVKHDSGGSYTNEKLGILYWEYATIGGRIGLWKFSFGNDRITTNVHSTVAEGDYFSNAEFRTIDDVSYCIVDSGVNRNRTAVYRCRDDDEIPGYRNLDGDVSECFSTSGMSRSAQGTYMVPYSIYEELDIAPIVDVDTFERMHVSCLDSIDFKNAVFCFSEADDSLLYVCVRDRENASQYLLAVDVEEDRVMGRIDDVGIEPYSGEDIRMCLHEAEGELYLPVCNKEDDWKYSLVMVACNPRTLEERTRITLSAGGERRINGTARVSFKMGSLFAVMTNIPGDDGVSSSGEELVAFDVKTGEIVDADLSSIAFDARRPCFAVSENSDTLYVACADNMLRCFDDAGALKWETEFVSKAEAYLRPLNDGMLFAQDSTGHLFLIEAATGRVIASAPDTEGWVFSSTWLDEDGAFLQGIQESTGMGFPAYGCINLDPESFGSKSHIRFAIGTDASGTQLICDTNDAVFTVPHWKHEDLVAYANDLVKDHALTAAQARGYHIE